jgi:hypothetical protein
VVLDLAEYCTSPTEWVCNAIDLLSVQLPHTLDCCWVASEAFGTRLDFRHFTGSGAIDNVSEQSSGPYTSLRQKKMKTMFCLFDVSCTDVNTTTIRHSSNLVLNTSMQMG